MGLNQPKVESLVRNAEPQIFDTGAGVCCIGPISGTLGAPKRPKMPDNSHFASIQKSINQPSNRPEYPNCFKPGQIPSLNGWRAVAILLVMLDHAKFTVGFPSDRLPGWVGVFFEQGNLGVRIFFVLSGFLITHLLLKEAESSGT